ncbi:hypothetical protein ABZ705_28305 [Streptomyces sp. NPDC006984]|uniref:hypothetical protein n=1 Tax=Streptomyces sp. NPDC006984 TaxID=3155463 RepID=UPI003401564C
MCDENWSTHWMTYEDADTDRGIVHDVCNGIRLITDTGVGDPVETVALSIAGAEAAEALAQALEGEWALYTPGQVTATASAVFSQLEGVLANLRALNTTLSRMEARRETAFTGAARERVEHAAAAVEFACGFAPAAISELQSLPQLLELPADAHELLTAVAGLLGPDAELRTFHGVGAYQEDDSGFGCGCEVLITHDGEVWSLHRGDSEWTMTRENDGKPQPDGSTTYASWIELTPTPTTSHPQHLAAEIRRALALPPQR